MAKPSLSIAIIGKGPAGDRPKFPASKPDSAFGAQPAKPANPFGAKPAARSSSNPFASVAKPSGGGLGGDTADETAEAAGEVSIKPEAVCFRTADQVCGSCEYNEAGTCKVLKTSVQDGDSCNAFEAKGEDAGMGMGDGMGMESGLGAGMGAMRQ